MQPSLLIADEPTTALDVTTQAQILELMLQLQRDMGMSIMLITHDLGVVAEMCEEVVVMYLGEVVEKADVKAMFSGPVASLHPGAAALDPAPGAGEKLGPRADRRHGARPLQPPAGCPFHPRCPSSTPGVCDDQHPQMTDLPDGRSVRCHLYSDW